MKKYFYFVREPNAFTPDSIVYQVACGSSKRELVKLELVREFCKDCGAYFALRSDASSNAVLNLAESLFPHEKCPSRFLRRKAISISELYDHIVDWDWENIEADHTVSPQFIHHFINSKFFISISKSVKAAKRDCLTVSRKYLSDDVCESPRFAVLNFGLILLLFVLATYVESLFR